MHGHLLCVGKKKSLISGIHYILVKNLILLLILIVVINVMSLIVTKKSVLAQDEHLQ